MNNTTDLDTFLREICTEPLLDAAEERALADQIVTARDAWIAHLASTSPGVWHIIDLAETVTRGTARLDEVFTYSRDEDRAEVALKIAALTEGLRTAHETAASGRIIGNIVFDLGLKTSRLATLVPLMGSTYLSGLLLNYRTLVARMVMHNTRFVVRLSSSYSGREGVDTRDLITEGLIGLSHAVELFDPSLGFKLTSFSAIHIKSAMSAAVNNSNRTIRVPSNVQSSMSAISLIRSELFGEGQPVDAYSLSEESGKTIEEVDMLLACLGTVKSLDSQSNPDAGDATIGGLLVDASAPDPVEESTRIALRERIFETLATINDPDIRLILELRYCLDSSPEGRSPTSDTRSVGVIAEMVGMKKEKTRRLLLRGESLLRRPERLAMLSDFVGGE